MKREKDSVKPSPCVVDTWADGNLTRSENITSLFPGQGNLVKKRGNYN